MFSRIRRCGSQDTKRPITDLVALLLSIQYLEFNFGYVAVRRCVLNAGGRPAPRYILTLERKERVCTSNRATSIAQSACVSPSPPPPPFASRLYLKWQCTQNTQRSTSHNPLNFHTIITHHTSYTIITGLTLIRRSQGRNCK